MASFETCTASLLIGPQSGKICGNRPMYKYEIAAGEDGYGSDTLFACGIKCHQADQHYVMSRKAAFNVFRLKLRGSIWIKQGKQEKTQEEETTQEETTQEEIQMKILQKQLDAERKLSTQLREMLTTSQNEVHYLKNVPEVTLTKLQQSINDTVSAIKMKPVDEQHKSMRQLQLQCHPDKHPQELFWFFNELFKMI